MRDLKPGQMHYEAMVRCIGNEIACYGIERGMTPNQLHEIFSEGIGAVAKERAETDELRKLVMIGAMTSAEFKAKYPD